MTTAKPADLQSEEAIIAEFWAPLAAGFAGAFGLKDDCAAITPAPGHDLVVTTDALIAGVHFFRARIPSAIAWKALAVNVSDLVAKGATPLAYVISSHCPGARTRVARSLCRRPARARKQRSVARLSAAIPTARSGPLSVSITAFGDRPRRAAWCAARRAAVGDPVYVSGTVGDAALGLALAARPGTCAALEARRGCAGRISMPISPAAAARRPARGAARHMRRAADGYFGRSRQGLRSPVPGLIRWRRDRRCRRPAVGCRARRGGCGRRDVSPSSSPAARTTRCSRRLRHTRWRNSKLRPPPRELPSRALVLLSTAGRGCACTTEVVAPWRSPEPAGITLGIKSGPQSFEAPMQPNGKSLPLVRAFATLGSTLSSLFGHIQWAVRTFGGQAKLGRPCRQPVSSAS